MKIAVTSQNFRTVTPHAGLTRRFLVYEVGEEGEPVEVERLDLPKEMSMHEWRGTEPHPLDGVDAVIAGSFGDGFASRMAARGITAVTTGLTDPVEAVRAFAAMADDIKPRPGHACCNQHRHGHGLGHGQGNGHGHAHAYGQHRPHEGAEEEDRGVSSADVSP